MSGEMINFDHPDLVRLSRSLGTSDILKTAQNCFEFVRDEIRHSSDHKINPVTCVASDVLLHRTGYCYAKSHLLCALLRGNGIPAGMCYQRLTIEGDQPPFCLHGLNAIHLPEIGWYRVDARGNRQGIQAEFDPPHEKLAFSTDLPGELNLPEIHVSPLRIVIECLSQHKTWDQVLHHLPDID